MPTERQPLAVILVVDDEAAMSRVVIRYLTHIGYRVIHASSAEQALAAIRLRQPPVDVVLSDIVMPEMDGLELASVVLAECPGPSVLLMAGQLAGEIERIEVGGRIVRVMRKPPSLDRLRDLLQVILEGYPADPEAGSANVLGVDLGAAP